MEMQLKRYLFVPGSLLADPHSIVPLLTAGYALMWLLKWLSHSKLKPPGVLTLASEMRSLSST